MASEPEPLDEAAQPWALSPASPEDYDGPRAPSTTQEPGALPSPTRKVIVPPAGLYVKRHKASAPPPSHGLHFERLGGHHLLTQLLLWCHVHRFGGVWWSCRRLLCSPPRSCTSTGERIDLARGGVCQDQQCPPPLLSI